MTQNIDQKRIIDLLLEQDEKKLNINDIISFQEKFKDPFILSVLIFKLMEERKKTNEIIKDISEKYDNLQFILKNNNKSKQEIEEEQILSDIDDKIISFVRSQGKIDAEAVKNNFNYKGVNAASQRLNKLVKDNYLKKIQAGRKVYFLVK